MRALSYLLPSFLLLIALVTVAPRAHASDPEPPASNADVDQVPVALSARDASTDDPLAAVKVFLRGGGLLGETDPQGHLDVALSPGLAVLSFVRPGYAPRVLELTVAPGAHLAASLEPAASELDELSVKAPYLEGALSSSVAERRTEKRVVEVLGAEEMGRAGDGDAAAALKRATGLTLVGGKYVYVRGLGERYSSTLLDGATLPSPEPERRVVPLDLFPTGVLSSVVVQKTWSPELPADFGGGTIALRTRRIPEEAFLQTSVSLGGVYGSTLSEAPIYRGGALDALGFDDGTRALPAELRAASNEQLVAEGNSLTGRGYSSADLERFGESLQRVYTPVPTLLPPNGSLALAGGDRWRLVPFDVGVVGAVGYAHDLVRTESLRRQLLVGRGGALEVLDEGTLDSVERNVALGGLLGLALDGDGWELSATSLLNRVTDDETKTWLGRDGDANTDIRVTRLRWVERMLLSERVAGAHELPVLNSELEWRYAYSLASRMEPDERETRYDRDPTSGVYLLSDRPEGNQRLFSELVDHNHDAAVQWKVPLTFSDDLKLATRSGVGVVVKSRAVDTRRFKLMHKGARTGDAALRAKPAEEVFAPDNIAPDGFQLAETTRKTDNYGGESLVGSAFVAADLELPARLTLTGGARVELAHVAVNTFELFNAAATPSVATFDTVDALPSLGLSWGFVEDMQLRAAGSLTVARPEMRELSPAIYTDVTGGRSRFGNPELQPTSIAHLDLRWEWYPSSASPTDLISVAAFAKHFDRPVETVITSGADMAVTYANAPSADLVGLEAEARFGFGVLHPWLAPLHAGGNGALIASRVEVPAEGTATSRERALEGQSPWVANASLGYDDEETGASAMALYNVFGPRIREVGALGAPDVIEQPFHQLDLVLGWRLPGGFALSAKAQNLIDAPAVMTQGDTVIEQTTRGRAFSVSASWKL